MSSTGEIEEYYDKVTDVYLRIYGKVIQAYRPSSEKKLLKYLAESIDLKKGQYILDAGCGVGGPAAWFASKQKVRIEGLTLSGEQVEIANDSIKRENLTDLVTIRKGDYHQLTTYYAENTFDGTIFLESLGHAEDPVAVIQQAAMVTKPDGFIFIKDFFKKESRDAEFQKKVDVIIDRMNEHYCYNTLKLLPVIEALRSCDFEIEYIKKFEFNDDTGVRARFEEDQKIEIFEGYEEFWPAEWLELKCWHKQG